MSRQDPPKQSPPPRRHTTGRGVALPQEDFIGALVGDVRISTVVHESETGLVLLGTQEGIGRLAAVKLLPRRGQEKKAADRLILKNAQVLSQLRHANIVTLYDVGLYQRQYPYLVMEYIAGGSLQTLLEEHRPLSPLRALGILQQIAHGLEDVHNRNLLHQNLSLENILMEELAGSGHDLAKLSNFGLSSHAATEVDANGYPVRLDRVPYMTPEEGMGANYNHLSDLYVCGVLLYQMLTCKFPYRALSLPEVWDEIVSRRPVPLAEANANLASLPNLQKFMDMIMSRNPATRPQNARLLRLMTGQLMAQIQQHLTARPGRGSFPVLNTIDRLPAITLQPGETLSQKAAGPQLTPSPMRQEEQPSLKIQPSPSPSQAPTRPDPIFTAQTLPDESPGAIAEGLKVQLEGAPGQTPKPSSAARARQFEAFDLEHIQWMTPTPTRLSSAQDMPYMVLIVHNPINDAVPPGLTTRLRLLLGATLDLNTVVIVFQPTNKPYAWLSYLSDCAREHHLCMGLSFGRRFDSTRRKPAPYTVRMALQAAQRAEGGTLVAARHAVDVLSVGDIFSPIDTRLAGRYASFMVYGER